jgi:hypothetical protein
MKLTLIDYGSHEWETLSAPLRTEIEDWIHALSAPPPTRGIGKWLTEIGESMGASYATARRKYDALVRSNWNWTVIIDKRSTAQETVIRDGTGSLVFRAHVVTLVGKYKRNSAAAFRALRTDWKRRVKVIPGYEGWPGWPAIPYGWSNRNLLRILKEETNRARLASIRIGTSSKTNPFLPIVHTTRVGLHHGAVIQVDDVRHDNIVTLGKNRSLVRVNELGALDLLSGHRYQWGAKPRRRRANETWEDIQGKDMRLFTAGLFHRWGYSPQGTMIMSEHNTAKVSEAVAKILYDATGGLVRVDYQPIEGKQAALTGYWPGTEGGNFRAKACLESLHNLIHNDLAALAMQTGSPSSGLQGPVTTERIVSYIAKIIQDVLKNNPERIHLLKLPTLDFHTQFIPFLMDYYHFGLAMRTDHHMEGWERLNYVITEYTALPGSDQWLSEQEFLKLPETSQAIIHAAARSEPARWTQRRNLSPLEVWDQRPRFNPIAPITVCDIIGEDMAREATAFRGFIEFDDQELSPDTLIYTARYATGPERGREIPHGQKVKLFANPFDDATAFVIDARGAYLGQLPLYKRACPINADAFYTDAPFEDRPQIRSQELIRAAGEKHQRIATMLEPDRINHREEVQEAKDLRAHNRRVINGEPITPDEIHQAHVAAGQQAHRTAAANRLQAHGNPRDWDAPATEQTEAWQDPFAATLPESNNFPDSI